MAGRGGGGGDGRGRGSKLTKTYVETYLKEVKEMFEDKKYK